MATEKPWTRETKAEYLGWLTRRVKWLRQRRKLEQTRRLADHLDGEIAKWGGELARMRKVKVARRAS